MNFKFRSTKCFRLIWKIHEELGCFDLIFGMYVEWRFHWCIICPFLEILWLSSAGDGRRRRPELSSGVWLFPRVFAMWMLMCALHVHLIGCDAFDLAMCVLTDDVCMMSHLMKRIVSFRWAGCHVCARVCEPLVMFVLTWSMRTLTSDLDANAFNETHCFILPCCALMCCLRVYSIGGNCFDFPCVCVWPVTWLPTRLMKRDILIF